MGSSVSNVRLIVKSVRFRFDSSVGEWWFVSLFVCGVISMMFSG